MKITTKATLGVSQLPMNVIGMVVYYDGDGAYAHYMPNKWPSDSNAIMLLLLGYSGEFLQPPLGKTHMLLPYPLANPFFRTMLWMKSRCLDAILLVHPNNRIGTIPLAKNLYLQLENSTKDNKHKYLMAFLSLLTTHYVFKKIMVRFLLVGHMHEDIDAYFSLWSHWRRLIYTFVFVDLMKSFMDSQEMSFMPEFI